MFRRSTPIYNSAVIVLNSSVEGAGNQQVDLDRVTLAPLKAFAPTTQLPAEAGEANFEIIKETLSSVPAAWDWELKKDYEDLGIALNEMSELADDEEWALDRTVFVAACFTASWLLHEGYPAPRVFSHGPMSAVFNWTNGYDNLYLTVSSDRLSALVSEPDKIKFRQDFDMTSLPDPSLAFLALRSSMASGSIHQLSSPLVTEDFALAD